MKEYEHSFIFKDSLLELPGPAGAAQTCPMQRGFFLGQWMSWGPSKDICHSQEASWLPCKRGMLIRTAYHCKEWPRPNVSNEQLLWTNLHASIYLLFCTA